MGLAEVSTILWRERNLLERLLFKLEEERLVVGAGLIRWLPRASREVDLVLGELKRMEASRSSALEAVGAELGLSTGLTLDDVAAAAPPPWDGLLDQHRQAFLETSLAIEPLQRLHREQKRRIETEAAIVWLESATRRESVSRDPTK